jgi:hypothetical protein
MHSSLTFFFSFPHGRNPLYLGIIFVVFLLLKALWVQLDISGEFRNGAVSIKLYYVSLSHLLSIDV